MTGALDVKMSVKRASMPVVRDVGFCLPAGSALAVTGRNGAGKTTLLHGLAGMLPSSGRITFFGKPIDGVPVYRRARMGIAVVPQGRRLFAGLTVADNLRAARLNPPGPGPVVDEFALFPELEAILQRPAGVLSGGQQQQVAIARALIRRPRVMLLDEPTEGLAPALATAMIGALRVLRDAGMTMIVAEQRPHLLEDLCAEFLVLQAGEAAGYGPPDEPAMRAHLQSL